MNTWISLFIAVFLAASLFAAAQALAGRQGGASASNHVVVQSRVFSAPAQSVFIQRQVFVSRPFVANQRVFAVKRQIIVTPSFFASPFVSVPVLTSSSFGMVEPFR
jgi:hypothetical protein